ncbi:DUF2092 domain-containing protein [Variovorax ureilyticus]|uniref:DUF2092 domain-containing protein n=1 Tax=Variovorax ureilyticus TaxID=1836198 RepID=A0ABU8VAD7_9BURK
MSIKLVRCAAAIASIVVMALGAQPAGAQSSDIDPHATQLLRRMTEYLAGLKHFSVDSDSTLEVVLTTGQKLQFDTAATATIRRPDRLRAERRGEVVDQVFYYDGASLTLFNLANRRYATVPAPATLDAALDFARDRLDIVAPASDLLATNAFERLTQDLVGAMVVGTSVIGGASTTHLAFRSPEVDFQVWVQDGDRPLPRKYVITTRRVEGMPQFAVTLNRWNLDPKVPDSLFAFAPPKDAKRIDFLKPEGRMP